MSGHSKWHTIRRTKGVIDQRRGQLFTKLGRDITIAAREGGSGDTDTNFRLRLAVDKARASNMPMDTIQRAIDRAIGRGGEAALEQLYYEGYAPGGIALMVEAATDNRNRTAGDVRSTFTKLGGTLGESGSVGWMFEVMGLITVDLTGNKLDPDEVQLAAIDAGADDVTVAEEEIEIYVDFAQLMAVRQRLLDLRIPVVNAEKVLRPKALIEPEVIDERDALQALKLIERLEDLDDVQKVYSNLNITDALVEKYEQV